MSPYSFDACHLQNIDLLKIDMPKIAISTPKKYDF